MSESQRLSHEPTHGNKEKENNTLETATTDIRSDVPQDDRYLHGTRLIIVHSSILLSVFLVALDQSIVSAAVPRIASQFNALEQVTWIVAAYFRMYHPIHGPCLLTSLLVTQAGLLLFFGRVLKIISAKSVFLLASISPHLLSAIQFSS